MAGTIAPMGVPRGAACGRISLRQAGSRHLDPDTLDAAGAQLAGARGEMSRSGTDVKVAPAGSAQHAGVGIAAGQGNLGSDFAAGPHAHDLVRLRAGDPYATFGIQ